MKILIDTHIAIWAVLNDPKLPRKAKAEKLMFLTHDSLIPSRLNEGAITMDDLNDFSDDLKKRI